MSQGKKNENGFIMMETLIVTLFIVGIFTFFYTNLYPLVGEYERREHYDPIQTKYVAHYLRKLIIDDASYASITSLGGTSYKDLSNCSAFADGAKCRAYVRQFGVTKFYLATYDLTSFKSAIAALSTTGETWMTFAQYVDYLPTFQNENKEGYFRLIVEQNGMDYATIEVKKP